MGRRVVGGRSDEQPVSRQLRQIITSRGLTAYALGKAAKVDAGVVKRFMNGRRGLVLATLDKIAAALNLRLVEADEGEQPHPILVAKSRGRSLGRSRGKMGGSGA
jgi:transcriptional regulator with XRE-family HTH domain